MAGVPGQSSEKGTEVADQYSDDFMAELDGRVRLARVLRRRFKALVSDLGGLTNLSYLERSLCKRVIHLERVLEKKESALALGEMIDENYYYSAVNAFSGLGSKLGLKRRSKVLTLDDYQKSKTREATTTKDQA